MDAISLIKDTDVTPTDDGGCSVRLKSTVSPADYALFKKMAEYAGGRYVNPKIGHVFRTSGLKTSEYMDVIARRITETGKINDLDFFPTPDEVCDRALDDVDLVDRYAAYLIEEKPAEFRVLEPSAGTGAFIDAFMRRHPDFTGDIVAVEIDPLRCEMLRMKYADNDNISVIEGDINEINRDDLGKFNLVLMNPPFSDWVRHLEIARGMLDQKFGLVASVLPELASVRSGRNAAKDRALDIVSECLTNRGIIDQLDKSAFAATRGNGRTSITSTNTACDIVVLTNLQEPHQKLVSDFSSSAEIVLENLHGSMLRIERLIQDGLSSGGGVDKIMSAIERDISENRHSLVNKGLCPIHSEYTNLRAVSASLIVSYTDNMGIELPEEDREKLKQAVKPLYYEEGELNVSTPMPTP